MSGLVERLRGIVGADACLVRPEELLVYECDGLTLHRAQPTAVVLPRTRDEVCRSFAPAASSACPSCRAGRAPASRAAPSRRAAAS